MEQLKFNRKEGDHMKEAYIEKIEEMMQNCNDITLLDLIFKLLMKEGVAA
jgi:hypothetical protein